jgi:hypothetical protein
VLRRGTTTIVAIRVAWIRKAMGKAIARLAFPFPDFKKESLNIYGIFSLLGDLNISAILIPRI